MDILWLMSLLWINLLCSSSSARISVLPIPKDFSDHGTQYRFQYYIRDERGDYKTQEEAGEGGSARGSYAVEEPDGDLRIVQYTTDLSGGFKAHIKVDHAGESSSQLQEIDISPAEMRKLMEQKRLKTTEKPEVDASKSYDLGPPRRMSDIVMEQAAAIKEIISKELEAEERREEEEKMRNKNKQVTGQEEVLYGGETVSNQHYKTESNGPVRDVLPQQNGEQAASDVSSQQSESLIPHNERDDTSSLVERHSSKTKNELQISDSSIETHSHMEKGDEERVIQNSEYGNSEAAVKIRNDKDNYHTLTNAGNSENKAKRYKNESIQDSKMSKKNSEIPESAVEMITPLGNKKQAPITRVASSLKAVEISPDFDPDHSGNSGKSNLQSMSSKQNSDRDILPVTSKPLLAGPLLEGPVRNFSFRNRIMFYKPTDENLKQASNPNLSQKITGEPQNGPESNITKNMKLNAHMNNQQPEARMLISNPQNDDQIVLYSPFQQIGSEGYHKTRYVTVPYAVLRPFLMSIENEKQ